MFAAGFMHKDSRRSLSPSLRQPGPAGKTPTLAGSVNERERERAGSVRYTGVWAGRDGPGRGLVVLDVRGLVGLDGCEVRLCDPARV